MAKATKAVSKHSRAARRATSPSINTDKSLKDVEPPSEPKHQIGVRHGAGITKRKAKSKQMSRTQKVRQERTLARAELVIHQLEKKKEKSVKKVKATKNRSGAWEDVNEKAGDKSRGRRAADADAGAHAGAEADTDEDQWEDAENVTMSEVQAMDEGAARGADTVSLAEHITTEAADPGESEEPGVW